MRLDIYEKGQDQPVLDTAMELFDHPENGCYVYVAVEQIVIKPGDRIFVSTEQQLAREDLTRLLQVCTDMQELNRSAMKSMLEPEDQEDLRGAEQEQEALSALINKLTALGG